MKPYPNEGSGRLAGALRWVAAGALVVAAHSWAGWYAVTHSIAEAAPPETVQGITIDLEPIAVPQNAPEPQATRAAGPAPVPQAAATPAPQPTPEATPPEPPQTTPVEPPPPEPVPPPPAPEPPPVVPPVVEPQPVSSPEPVPPPPPVESKTDAVLAPPPPPKPAPIPRPFRPAPRKPDPQKIARAAAARAAQAERWAERRTAHAAARTEAAQRAAQAMEAGGRSDQAAAPSGASSGASVSTWRGEVVAHLNGFKPASPNGAGGTARVAFSVDRGGRVLSASLAGSSGDATLDAAAVAMVRRASPVPAPPPELGGRVSLAVPVRFH